MLLTKLQIQQVLSVIKKRHNLFVAKTIGHETLTKQELDELREEFGESEIEQVKDFIKDGYFVGFLRNKDLGSVTDISHEEFADQAKPFLNSLQEYSVEHGKEVTNSYLQKLSSSTQNLFETIIREYNHTYKDYLMINPGISTSIIATQEGRSVSEMVTALRDITGDVARDWSRVARTEITNIINVGMIDKIVKMNPDEEPESIYIFKRVVNDASLCKYCLSFHLEADGVTPKIYRLSEVMGNGTNVGKKVADWNMVVGAVHPHCRCQIVQLPPGMWFNKDGQFEFIGEEEANKKIEKNLQ